MRELARLLGAIERDETLASVTSFGRRGTRPALLALLAYGGLRRSELLGLDWDDVDLSRRLVRIRKAKGGRQRTIPIHPALAPLFAEYYATRLPLTEQAVFVGVQGGRLNVTQLAQTFRHYVEASGVGGSGSGSPRTRSGTSSPPSSFGRGRTCARSRSCSGTSTSTRRSATRVSTRTSCAARSNGSAGSAEGDESSRQPTRSNRRLVDPGTYSSRRGD